MLVNDVYATKLPFIREPNGLIFRLDVTIKDYIFTAKRLYILNSYIKDVLEIVYRDRYLGYARYLEKASAYITKSEKFISTRIPPGPPV